jgi:hypothetical protein
VRERSNWILLGVALAISTTIARALNFDFSAAAWPGIGLLIVVFALPIYGLLWVALRSRWQAATRVGASVAILGALALLAFGFVLLALASSH